MPALFYRKIIFLIFVLSISACITNENSAPIAQNAVLDLRTWSFEKDGIVDLKGEWEFFWLALYDTPEQINNAQADAMYPVPRRWGGFILDDKRIIPPTGYASFRLKVLMSERSENAPPLRIFLGSSDTAYKVIAFDKHNQLIGTLLSGGQVGTSRDNDQPMWVRDSSPLANHTELTLIWQISNFDMLSDGGGPKKAIRIGLDKDIIQTQSNEMIFAAIATGIMLIMAIYHLILFILRPNDSAPLWFGLSCLFMCLYSVLTPHYFELNFPQIDAFETLTKLLFICASLPSAFTILFFRSLFPNHAGNYLWKLIIIIIMVYTTIVSLTPLIIYDNIRAIVLIIAALSGIWFSFVFIKAIFFDKSLIAFLLSIGFIIFGISSANDLLVANAVIGTPYIAPYGLSIFILFQAIVIAIQNQKTHREKLIAQQAVVESNEKALAIERAALEEQKSLTASFQRFVPADFLRLLGKEKIQDVQLGDFTKKEMSVLFSDIRSFTTLSENMSPEDNFKFLNSYLKRMEPIIHKNNGVIDKYIGDAIMATFLTANDSIQAAIEMIQELDIYNTHRKNSSYLPISIGIGINTGHLMLGTIGGANRMEGTVISDAVNLAARLEGLTKMYGASIAISENTLSQSSIEKFETRILDTVIVKGKSEPVTIYEVLNADAEDIKVLKMQSGEFILKSIQHRRNHNLEEAKKALLVGKSFFPNDKTITQHLKVIEQLLLLGLPDDWKGAIILDNK